MRPRFATGFVAALILTTAAAVQGQGPPNGPPRGMGGPGGPGGPGGGPMLVMSPSVQEEIKLSTKQKDQLKKLQANVAQRSREAFENQDEGGPDFQEMMAVMTRIRREQEASVAKILDKRQKDRIAQIELQREGLLAVARKDIATKLKLTATQTKKIRTISDEMQRTIAGAMPRPPGGGGGFFPGGGPPPGGGGAGARRRGNDNGNGNNDGAPGAEGRPGPGDRAAGDATRPGGGFPGGGPPNFNSEEARAQFAKMRETTEKARKDAAAKVGEVLTAAQKASFDKMLGEPFDLSTIRFGPPGGGPGGGPGRGRGPGPDGGGPRPAGKQAPRSDEA